MQQHLQGFRQFLRDHVHRLHKGSFPVNGQHARLIVGTRGIGKSTLLQEAVLRAETQCSNIVALYVSWVNPRPQCVMVDVCQHLRHRGLLRDADVQYASATNQFRAVALHALKRADMRLLLVVDEAEQMYRVDGRQSPVEAAAARDTLWNLTSLGTHSGDCTAVLLCGSTPFLGMLTSRRECAFLGHTQFPNVSAAPNLNRHSIKFKQLWVQGGGLPTRSLHQNQDGDRRTLFYAGASGQLGPVQQPPTTRFWNALMQELCLANRHWLPALQCRVTKRVDPVRVGAVPWETVLRPVTETAVRRAWRDSGGHGDGDERSLACAMYRLMDAGHIVGDFHAYGFGSAWSVPQLVYPRTASQLFLP